jgi:hypothetical protein
MKIDLLYFDGCPSWEGGMHNLMAALEAEGLVAEIDLVNVREDVQAARLKFLGSPSFTACRERQQIPARKEQVVFQYLDGSEASAAANCS